MRKIRTAGCTSSEDGDWHAIDCIAPAIKWLNLARPRGCPRQQPRAALLHGPIADKSGPGPARRALEPAFLPGPPFVGAQFDSGNSDVAPGPSPHLRQAAAVELTVWSRPN